VARGFEQQHGLDYEETFVPVVKWGTLRGLAALAAKRMYSIFHLDVKTAFLHGHLKEEVFITQPQGFVASGQEHLVCRLHKALYGLRQAPHAWYEKIDSFLTAHGFERGDGDSNLYWLVVNSDVVLLALYIDDILLTGSSSDLILSIKCQLEIHFEMSDMGDGTVALYLKVELVQVPSGIFMTQRGYCKKILETFNMLDAHGVSTPMVDRPHLLTDMQEDFVDPTLYRSMVGKLLHLTHTRPDITYSVSVVSRFMAKPQLSHLQAVKLIFRYLSSTWDYGIFFGRGSNLALLGYSDSDYAGDLESGAQPLVSFSALVGAP
jgi:hypothetical protein